MGKKRGRPTEVVTRSIRRNVRLSLEEDYHFKKVCDIEGLSYSDGLRMAIKALRYLSDRDLLDILERSTDDEELN